MIDSFDFLNAMQPREYRRYSVNQLQSVEAWELLKAIFETKSSFNEMNFVMFSTSGMHGSYSTIEDAERRIQGKPCKGCENDCFLSECFETKPYITFIIAQPRLVRFYFGNLEISNQEEIDWLKWARDLSWKAMLTVGKE